MKFVASIAGRADAVVAAELPGASRRRLAELFAGGDVMVNGRVARKGDTVESGAAIELRRLPTTAAELRPQPSADLAIDIIYIDDDLIAINKPAGLPTQPLRAGELGTAANWLTHAYPETDNIGDDPREAGWLHRLDRGTSGVLLAARHRTAWLHARTQFREHRVTKTYLAIVAPATTSGSSQIPLNRRGRKTIADHVAGQSAETTWTVAEQLTGATLLTCQTRTGRMHQIRAHLALAGHAIIGDELYGSPAALDHFFLHAATLTLRHPTSGEPLTITAALPPPRHAFLETLR